MDDQFVVNMLYTSLLQACRWMWLCLIKAVSHLTVRQDIVASTAEQLVLLSQFEAPSRLHKYGDALSVTYLACTTSHMIYTVLRRLESPLDWLTHICVSYTSPAVDSLPVAIADTAQDRDDPCLNPLFILSTFISRSCHRRASKGKQFVSSLSDRSGLDSHKLPFFYSCPFTFGLLKFNIYIYVLIYSRKGPLTH